MNISDEAVEAALAASRAYESQRSMDNAEKQMRAIVDAAAPFIAAEAWDEGRGAGFRDAYADEAEEEPNPYRSQA